MSNECTTFNGHGGLGRRVPSNFDHVTRRPFSAMKMKMPETPIEHSMILPSWHQTHDQGQEGACVGFGTSMMLSILNEHQCRKQGDRTPYVRYNPWWLWDRAKENDEWPDSNPGDQNGSSVKAACYVLSVSGHVTWDDESDPKSFSGPNLDYGINNVRWARSVDEMRIAIGDNIPCAIGINWYDKFAEPEYVNAEYWIGRGDLGPVVGGHCLCVYAASDSKAGFRLKNSWGKDYPEVWIPYTTMERLINEDGEIALVTDR